MTSLLLNRCIFVGGCCHTSEAALAFVKQHHSPCQYQYIIVRVCFLRLEWRSWETSNAASRFSFDRNRYCFESIERFFFVISVGKSWNSVPEQKSVSMGTLLGQETKVRQWRLEKVLEVLPCKMYIGFSQLEIWCSWLRSQCPIRFASGPWQKAWFSKVAWLPGRLQSMIR